MHIVGAGPSNGLSLAGSQAGTRSQTDDFRPKRCSWSPFGEGVDVWATEFVTSFTNFRADVIGTLLLSRSDVERLLTPDACMAAVEDAFRQNALGKAPLPGILSLRAEDDGFHIKALLTLDRTHFAAKTNANFPHNGPRHGLPTVQGVVVRLALREIAEHNDFHLLKDILVSQEEVFRAADKP